MKTPAQERLAERKRAAAAEALVERLCSCLECGTICRASSVSWDSELWGVSPETVENLRGLVGLEWEMLQGYGRRVSMHRFECPPCGGTMVEVEATATRVA